MLAQVSLQHGGERDNPSASSGFRWPEGRPATALLDELAVHSDGACVQVDVTRTKRGQLGPLQACESAEQDQDAVSRVDGVGQGVDLGNRQCWPLGAVLLTSALDAAWVSPDDPVIDGCVEDGTQQPVRLRRGDNAEPAVEQFLAPAAYVRFADFSDRSALEMWRDVQPEQVAVEPDGLGPEVGPFLDPRRAVVGKTCLACVGVDPVAVEDLRFLAGQPDLSAPLGPEGLASRALIGAIEERHGPITRIMLGRADWDASRPRRLRVDGPAGSRVVRLGWFETMPAGLLTAIARAGRTDLLTVPPQTGELAARAAMEQAAQASNRTRTPALLAAIATAAVPGRSGGTPVGATPDSIQLSTWEWEGGQGGAKSPRAATSAAI